MNTIFDPIKKTILVKVENFGNIPEIIKSYAEENQMNIKKEIHLTVVGFSHAKILINKLKELNDLKQKNILNQLENLCKDTNFEIIPTNAFFHIKKNYKKKDGKTEHRESIICLVEIENFMDFISKIEELFEIKLPELVPHITLFTKSDDTENQYPGIGIDSVNDFLNLSPKKILIK